MWLTSQLLSKESSFYTHNSYHFHEPFERQTWSSITKRDSVRQNDASIAREVIVDFSRRSWAFVLDGRRLIRNLFRRIAYIVKLPISGSVNDRAPFSSF